MSDQHLARKRFGQNFLSDPNIIRKIIEAIRPLPGDRMVEIGPGLGAMTEPLMARLDHLHVVEIDRDLIARLKEKHPPERLTIHEGDALKFDFATIVPDGVPLGLTWASTRCCPSSMRPGPSVTRCCPSRAPGSIGVRW